MKASEVIKHALTWEGYNEMDKSFEEIIDIYNSQLPLPRKYKVKYSDEWCATFISAISVYLNIKDIIPTECSCQRMIDKFKAINCWREDENIVPEKGWIIFYDWQDKGSGDATGWADHVGLVIEASKSSITVLEGNYDRQVKRRKIAPNARYIRGYGVPKYEKETTPSPIKYKHKVGESITISTYYKNANDEIKKAVGANPWITTTIISIVNGARNPYKTAKGTYVNDGDIRSNAEVQAASKPASTTSKYYPKYKGSSTKIDEVLKAIGVPSTYYGSYLKRKKIAAANGIKVYAGTAAQNLSLISKAKAGTLLKP